MAEFLEALASKVKANSASADAYKKLHKPPSAPEELGSGGKLRTPVFYHHIQVRLAVGKCEETCVTIYRNTCGNGISTPFLPSLKSLWQLHAPLRPIWFMAPPFQMR